MARALTQAQATLLDARLMDRAGCGFAVEITTLGGRRSFATALMELAGLSVAEVVHHVYGGGGGEKHALVCVGTGNNGGDGLVCARHLWHWGWCSTVWVPKRPTQPHLVALLRQLESLRGERLSLVDSLPQTPPRFTCVVDAVFGFSFKPPVRAPFDDVLRRVRTLCAPVVAVDVPSGWCVDEGPSHDDDNGDVALSVGNPAVLVSLTAPKPCARFVRGRRFVGGRFVPPSVAREFDIEHLLAKGYAAVGACQFFEHFDAP